MPKEAQQSSTWTNVKAAAIGTGIGLCAVLLFIAGAETERQASQQRMDNGNDENRRRVQVLETTHAQQLVAMRNQYTDQERQNAQLLDEKRQKQDDGEEIDKRIVNLEQEKRKLREDLQDLLVLMSRLPANGVVEDVSDDDVPKPQHRR